MKEVALMIMWFKEALPGLSGSQGERAEFLLGIASRWQRVVKEDMNPIHINNMVVWGGGGAQGMFKS